MNELEELRVAQNKLEPEGLIRALACALHAWRAPDSLWRARLVRQHPLYSHAVLEKGTVMALEEWTEHALRSLRKREIVGPCWVPPVTAVWLAGSIPSAAFQALLLPLLAGSAIYVKPSSHDPVSPRLFADSLRAVDPSIAAAVQVGTNENALDEADAVIAYGSDDTIAEIRARVSGDRTFIGHGHKLSLAAVGSEVDVEQAAADVALDIALYDGRGCLSPAYILVLDEPSGRASAFCVALGDALEQLSQELPRGPLTPGEEVALYEMRAAAAMREGVQLEMPEDSEWTVMLEPTESHPHPGWLRHIPVIPLRESAELIRWCATLEPHLSTLGHIGWAAQPELTSALRAGAGSRLCPTGRMQFPQLDWFHDGFSPLGSLVRYTSVEKGRR